MRDLASKIRKITTHEHFSVECQAVLSSSNDAFMAIGNSIRLYLIEGCYPLFEVISKGVFVCVEFGKEDAEIIVTRDFSEDHVDVEDAFRLSRDTTEEQFFQKSLIYNMEWFTFKQFHAFVEYEKMYSEYFEYPTEDD